MKKWDVEPLEHCPIFQERVISCASKGRRSHLASVKRSPARKRQCRPQGSLGHAEGIGDRPQEGVVMVSPPGCRGRREVVAHGYGRKGKPNQTDAS